MPVLADMVIDELIKAGYHAYLVGGCVRDMILRKQPKDYDITTSATPDQVKEIFKGKFNIIDTGIKHGTVTLMVNYALDDTDVYSVEVTTFRVDGKYTDNRHPDDIKFTNSLTEDLSRRDFTINAMAFNKQEGLIDPFYGLGDINSKIIKCVGNPNERFQEDALRMLRAVRFAAQLEFGIEKHTCQAIHGNHDLIKNVSIERVSEEINKILRVNPLEMYTVDFFKLLDYAMPELNICFWTNQDNPYHCYSVGKHLIHSANEIENNLCLRLTMLLHDIAKPKCKTIDENGNGHFYGHAEESAKMAIEILKRMKYDNLTIMRVRDLIFYHDSEIQDNRKSVRRWLNKIGESTFRDLLKVKEADIKAQNLEYYQDRHDKLERVKIILEDVLNDNECFSKKDLAINGTDLMQMGYPEGKQIGEIINKLIDIVLDDPTLNTKEKLVEIVKETYNI